MNDIRDALNIAVGVAFIFALPTIAVWGVVILMAWLQKAVGL